MGDFSLERSMDAPEYVVDRDLTSGVDPDRPIFGKGMEGRAYNVHVSRGRVCGRLIEVARMDGRQGNA